MPIVHADCVDSASLELDSIDSIEVLSPEAEGIVV